MEIITTGIHIGDRIFGALLHPVLYFINRWRYRNYLGDYTAGKGRITIKYTFFDWGKFSIDAIEPSGEKWEGKYEEKDSIMTGRYKWNFDKNPSVPDTGEHMIVFSPDKTKADVTWKNLTGSRKTGTVTWEKINI